MTILSTFLLLITFFFSLDLLLIHIVVFFNKKTEKKNTKQMRIEHSVQKKSWFLEREKNKKNRSKYYFGISWGRVWSPGFWESNRAK